MELRVLRFPPNRESFPSRNPIQEDPATEQGAEFPVSNPLRRGFSKATTPDMTRSCASPASQVQRTCGAPDAHVTLKSRSNGRGRASPLKFMLRLCLGKRQVVSCYPPARSFSDRLAGIVLSREAPPKQVSDAFLPWSVTPEPDHQAVSSSVPSFEGCADSPS